MRLCKHRKSALLLKWVASCLDMMVLFKPITLIAFKVDRSVTGLVAQQQCVGPLHTPVADVAVTALTYFDTVGSATAIGEQPIKGLVDPACGARMAVGEALTNLVFARISDLKVRKWIMVIFLTMGTFSD